jgi:DNA-binding transcriptional MerR regulator
LATAGEKDPGARLTIGELSQELGVAQHILRYWETRFPQLKPMQRAGNRRYYRPSDVELVRKINRLLNQEGYTVRGVQKLLRDRLDPGLAAAPTLARPAGDSDGSKERFDPPVQGANEPAQAFKPGIDVSRLIALRDRLVDALDS